MKKLTALVVFLSFYLFSPAQGGIWTWVNGSQSGTGVYGTMGITNSADYPGGRYQAVNWIDNNGNFWIFGGYTSLGVMSDLWEYSPVNNTWTWVNGANTSLLIGSYGTMGVPSPSNQPGARSWGAVSWTDQAGNLWMHGGQGYDAYGNSGLVDDMWMYNIATNEWTWMAGSNVAGAFPNYGAQGIASATNTPGGISECNTAWVKSDGTLWTFGGFSTNAGASNDMWKFDIATNEWTWMSGDQGAGTFNYGTLGVTTATNLPPGRGTYTRWQDANDDFYIFGGVTETFALYYNDTWKYNTNSNEWTWVSGSSTTNDPGEYTNACSPGGGALPPARFENRTAQQRACTDVFWTFGGTTDPSLSTCFNDLWNFNTVNQNWTWVSGSSSTNSQGNWGTIGVPSPTNIPDPRGGVCMWVDGSGAIWMWSGDNISGTLESDMWKFMPDTACLHSALFINPTVSVSDSIICPGDTVRLYFQGGHISSMSPSANAILELDSAHVLLFPPVTTTYTFVEEGACNGEDTFRYTVNISHLIPIATSLGICVGDTFDFYGQKISAVGTYSSTINNPNGCDTMITLTVTPGPPEYANATAAICSGGTLNYGGMLISAPGVYTDTLHPVRGCDSIVTLTVSLQSAIYTSANQSICDGDSIFINGQPVYTAGTFVDTLSGSGGCDSIVTISLQILPKPIAGFSIEPAGDSIALGNISVTKTVQGADSIAWTLNNQLITLVNDSSLPIAGTGYYCIRLIALSSSGCTDTSKQCIYVTGSSFAMPDAFSPNGDGKNESFYPVLINPAITHVLVFNIYNRWGQLIYSNPLAGWDGTYKEDPQPEGVYTYFLTVGVPDVNNPGQLKEIPKAGSFSLFR